MSDFRITSGRGFQMLFDNGFLVSVQFGGGNYCDNRDKFMPFSEVRKDTLMCNNAEIAVINTLKKDNKFVTRKFYRNLGDDVKGWVSPNEVAKLIEKVSKWKRGG